MRANLQTLDPAQRALWPELVDTPPEFVLYGGVALSLRFAHRASRDFDFFARCCIDPESLLQQVPYLKGAKVLQLAPNTLICLVERGGPVHLSFFGLPHFGQAQPPETEVSNRLQIASLLDIAATKASTIQKRAFARDYLDLDLILCRADYSLTRVLLAARILYGPHYNPHVTLKALSYFEDGDLATLSGEVRARLHLAVALVDLAALG